MQIDIFFLFSIRILPDYRSLSITESGAPDYFSLPPSLAPPARYIEKKKCIYHDASFDYSCPMHDTQLRQTVQTLFDSIISIVFRSGSATQFSFLFFLFPRICNVEEIPLFVAKRNGYTFSL